jgi:nicotinate phosphoribosyltransferase
MNERTRALHTDLYQLTMIVGYLRRNLAGRRATCEAFVRRLPRSRSLLLVAGLARIVEYLEGLRFTEEQVAFLRRQPALRGAIDDDTARALLSLRFTGDLFAMPEGTVAFANEPLLRVEAPLPEAQIVETELLSILNHSTLIASKAARIVAAAGGASVLEFGTRRTHDEAAVDAARAAYLAGCAGTSNVEAGFRFGIPVFGTAAHMWTMAHETEAAAFDSYLAVYPEKTTLLVDTYGILGGTRRACEAALRTGRRETLGGVRIDCDLFDGSGAPTGICRRVRELLDSLGFPHTRIVVSDDMNEQKIARLLGAGEPIDSFGVGTELVTSKDAPALGGVYKLVLVGEGAWARAVSKLSPGKSTLPGAHQVLRTLTAAGRIEGDVIALADEQVPGERLLVPVMRGGRLLPEARPLLDLAAARARARAQLAALGPEAVLAEEPVIVARPSPRLAALARETEARILAETASERSGA